jgi:tubulin delta
MVYTMFVVAPAVHSIRISIEYPHSVSRTRAMITLQIGQCGNQVGAAFFGCIADEALDPSSPGHRSTFDRFFRLPSEIRRASESPAVPIARAVLVDMEPKVIQSCLANAGDAWRYDATRTFARQSGSANNWAYGYYLHGPATREAVMERVRKEVECADQLVGFLSLHSLAGGTGSGVGSCLVYLYLGFGYEFRLALAALHMTACTHSIRTSRIHVEAAGAHITEAVCDEFGSRAMLVNAVVMPFEVGEVTLQNYNALLTLASLSEVCFQSACTFTIPHEHSDLLCGLSIIALKSRHAYRLQSTDAVILMQNEHLHAICQKRLSLASPTFNDLNLVLARTLASVLLPTASSVPEPVCS